jgi:aarF domain-containing kinase
VQHAGLATTSAGDIAAVCGMVELCGRLFPDFQYMWLADEIAPNLPLELDFAREASNSERCAASFSRERHYDARLSAAVRVPAVRRELTTKRVLTMEVEEG